MCVTYCSINFLFDKLVAGKIGHTHHGRRRHRGHFDGDIFLGAQQYGHLLCHEQMAQFGHAPIPDGLVRVVQLVDETATAFDAKNDTHTHTQYCK